MGKRFRDVRRAFGDKERNEFAAADLGLSVTSVAKYERGEAEPTAGMLEPYIRLGVDVRWLITGQGAMFSGPRPNTQLQFVPDTPDHMVIIPQFEIRAAAGSGALAPAHEFVHSYFTVDREWLQRMLPSWASSNARVGILQGAGDSMAPTIDDGDMIMVAGDPPWDAVRRGGVFVVLHHDELRIKRLQYYPKTGDIDLISDNPRYAKETVKAERAEFELRIIGQVFFTGGRLKG